VHTLCCGSRRLMLDRPRVMGVLNITPDSFSDGGYLYHGGKPDLARIKARAEALCAAGADVLDIGGESTRPGAERVNTAEELRRVIPALQSVQSLNTIISVDTRKTEVARVALQAGVHMINDVGALLAPGMLDTLAATDAAVCLMHMQGAPHSMQHKPCYRDVVREVREFLNARATDCLRAGIDARRIVLDPGFGFGKTLAHNLKLLSRLEQCRSGDLPLLVGLSRKSMIGALTGRDKVEQRRAGSLAAATIAALRGADIIRTHDVAATVDALAVAARVRQECESL